MTTITGTDASSRNLAASAADAVATMAGTLRRVDRSAWVSWGCYYFGLIMAATPATLAELTSGGTALLVLAGAVAVFFVSLTLIQSHMRLSLTATSFGSPQRLVTAGIFQRSRNPIYVAFLLPLASLAWLSPAAALAATALYIVAMNRLVIAREEQELDALFGADYAAYRAATPRWLGF